MEATGIVTGVGEKCESPKSPDGKHQFGPEHACHGSWYHNDQGGPIYNHRSRTCKFCDRSQCFGWKNAKPTEGGSGWY